MPPSRSVRVLHVDDDPEFAELVATLLEDRGFEVWTETRPQSALERFEQHSVDCIVSDYDMPGTTGIDLLETVREREPSLPFILFTGKGTEEVASQAISTGVTDYLQKGSGTDQFDVLANRIENAVEQHRYGRQFETLVENLPGIVYRARLTPPWPIEFMAGDVEEITGYTAGPFERGELTIGENLIHPADATPVANEMQQQLEQGKAFEITYRIRTRSGETRRVRDRGQIVEQSSGSDAIIEGFITDITESEQRQRELAKRRTVFQTLVEHLPVGVLVEDESREIIAVNSTFCKMFELEMGPQKHVGRDCVATTEAFKHLFTDPDAFIADIESALDSREPVRRERELTDGRLFECEYIPYDLPDGKANMWVYRDITDERERERLLRGLFEDSPTGISIVQLITDERGEPVDYVYLDVNEQFAELTGLSTEDVVGERVTNVLDGIEETGFIERFGEVALTGEPARFEQYSEPLGRHYDVSVFSPQPGRCITIFLDITERKEREHELERFKTFVENSSDVIVHLDEAGRMRYQSAGTRRLFDHEPGMNLGENVFEFIHPDDRERVVNAFIQGLENEEKRFDEVEMRVEDANGEYVWVEAGGVDQSHTELGGVIVSLRDISERKAREQELKRYGQTLEALHEMTQTLLEATDTEQVTEVAMTGIREILSFEIAGLWLVDSSREQLEPTVLTERGGTIVDSPPRYTADGQSLSWDAFERNEFLVIDDVHDYENRHNPETPIRSEIIAPLGEHGILNVGATELGAFDDDDATLVDLWAGTVTMVLSQIEREQELRERETEIARERDRLEEFVSVLSHDIRNPLGVAVSRLELLSDETESEHLDAAQRGLDRMERLLEDLLVLVREGESVTTRDAVNLCDLATDCWRTVQTNDATIECNTSQAVLADSSRLSQVFENLFRNAVEHSSTNPQSHVPEDAVEHNSTNPQSQAPEDAVEHDTASEKNNRQLQIRVGDLPDGFYIEDNGPGIPEDERNRVFESGYSTTNTGTGLGLAIVRRIVEAHGWEIRAIEGSDGGARFEITDVESV